MNQVDALFDETGAPKQDVADAICNQDHPLTDDEADDLAMGMALYDLDEDR